MSAFDDNHRTVIQVADSLRGTFTRLDDLDFQFLTRQEDRFQGIGDFIQIDHVDIMQAGNFVQVKVARYQLSIQVLGEQDQFHVNWLAIHVRCFTIVKREVEPFHFLQSIEHVQAPATARSSQLVATVRNGL